VRLVLLFALVFPSIGCAKSDKPPSNAERPALLGSPEMVIDAKTKIARMAISSDGEYVAIATFKSVTICRIKTGVKQVFDISNPTGLDFSSTGILACGTLVQTKGMPLLASYIILLDPATGKETARWPVWQDAKFETINPIGAVKFSGNGKFLAVGSTNLGSTGGLLSIYDVEKQSLVSQRQTRTGGIVSLSVSPDGTNVYAGTPRAPKKKADLICWQRDTDALRERQGHSGAVWATAVAPRHKLIVTGGGSESAGPGESEMIVWDLNDARLYKTIAKEQSCIACLAINEDESLLASGDLAGTVLLWQMPSLTLIERVLCSKDAEVTLIRFSSDSLYIGTGDGKAQKYTIRADGKLPSEK
jgi:WD40 repeat protein